MPYQAFLMAKPLKNALSSASDRYGGPPRQRGPRSARAPPGKAARAGEGEGAPGQGQGGPRRRIDPAVTGPESSHRLQRATPSISNNGTALSDQQSS
jgi:hypothetical protein